MTIAVIVPAFDAAASIGPCLEAIASSSRTPDEVLVVDDGSKDETARIAGAHGARVLDSGAHGGGPGRARNLAARRAASDIIIFIDSDVVVAPDAIERLVAPMTRSSAVVATFGSYTDRSPVARVAGRYANLRHHDVHQRAGPEAQTFWSGLGAVRRQALLAAGGFASEYERPSIEDIELGARLTAAGGSIRIVPDARGTHLKNWSILELWRTDVRQRAIPWAAVAVRQGRAPSSLNADARGRVSAVALLVAIAGISAGMTLGAAAAIGAGGAGGLGGARLGMWAAGALIAGLAGAIVWVLSEWSLLRLLARHGARTLAGGLLLHACYTIYAPATVVLAMAWMRARGAAGRARAAGPAA